MPTSMWTDDRLERLNERFADRAPRELLAWCCERFGEKAVMGTGFGSSGVVLMHLLSDAWPGTTVFYLDTDLLFQETYDLRDKLDQRLDLNLVRVHSRLSLVEQANQHEEKLWAADPDRCCFLRKVQPLQEYLAGKDAWITAIRRDQSPTRADARLVEWVASSRVLKINPLAGWTEDEVWNYIRAHGLPYNPLHDKGYPSIGCTPCTAPNMDDTSDLRAGRWPDLSKTECGLHR